ncbi:MAG: glycosyl hydrolase family 28 protein [Cyclobacteriaceae bacterium]
MKTSIITIFISCLPILGWATDTFYTTYFEAEAFTSQTGGCKASTEYFPYIGDGYLEMGGNGSTVSWNNIEVPKAGKYTLIFKYSNNTEAKLSCDLKVNGTPIRSIPFGPFKKNWTVPRDEATEYSPETVGWAKYWNARVIVDLKAGANTVELSVTSEAGGPHIDNIGVSTAISEPPTPVVNVKDYGAVADGSTDNTEAIAKAIAACPPGGSVVFDEGVYMSGSVTLKANMTLWISENAVLRALPDNGKINYYPEGAFTGKYITRYFVFGNEVDNLTITGGGAIDKNITKRLPGQANIQRPAILGFANSENVRVTNVDLIHGDFWAFVPNKSDNVIIDGVNLFNVNKDGITPIDCHDMSITNSVISSGDDAMCPKSYDQTRGIKNLTVRNLTINYTKWKGFKMGASTKGGFTNSIIEDIAMVHTHSGLALYAMSGCDVTNIRFNRIKMNNVQTPFFIVRDVAESTETPGMQDIHISNIEVRNVYGQEGSSIQGTARDGQVYPIKNIYLTNVSVKDFKGGLETVPETPKEFPGGYPETKVFGNFPAWGFFMRHVENVVFDNVTYGVSGEDAREDIVLEDVKGFKNLGPGNK